MNHPRTSFERLIVSDERQAQSAAPGAWQTSTRVLATTFFLIGAGWVQGATLTGQPALAALAALVFFALVVWKLDPTDWYLEYISACAHIHSLNEELSTTRAGYDRILAESGGRLVANRNLAAENDDLRRTIDGLRATVEGQEKQIAAYRDMLQLDHDARPAEVYTGRTERIEVAQ